MQTPSIQYQAALRTLAVASGPFRPRVAPLPPNYPNKIGKVGEATGVYAFDQEFEILMSSFPPAQKNTQASAAGPVFAGLLDTNAILTRLSQPTPTGAGRGKFTGSFARVPAPWDDFVSQTVMFPGWLNYNNISYLLAGNMRPQKPHEVTVRVRHDYFVIDQAGILTGAGVLDSAGNAISTVTVKGAIPTLAKQVFYTTYGGTTIQFSDANDLVPTAGLLANGIYYCPTVPSIGSYQSWCNVVAALAVAWDATHPPAWDGATDGGAYGQWRFKDSLLVEYEGNIIDRQSFYVLAK